MGKHKVRHGFVLTNTDLVGVKRLDTNGRSCLFSNSLDSWRLWYAHCADGHMVSRDACRRRNQLDLCFFVCYEISVAEAECGNVHGAGLNTGRGISVIFR
jgi:hypothetical protein